MTNHLDHRSREILRLVIDAYLETGAPVGSKTLSQKLGLSLSSATIRNVMASLEEIGLLFSPHTSAGRLPTDLGLRFFVDGLLETGALSPEEEISIRDQCQDFALPVHTLLERAISKLSGLSNCAGLVTAPKSESAVRHIEFVYLEPGRALVVLVTESGSIENRIIEIPSGVLASSLQQASNYLNTLMVGKTLTESLSYVAKDLEMRRRELDVLSQKVIESGLAVWNNKEDRDVLIVRGQANLLQQAGAFEDLNKIAELFEVLEARETLYQLLGKTQDAEGVQIYIGSENQLFGLTGCSLILSPLKNSQHRIIGAVGVIGPTRMNYARIVPLVDYTAKVVTTLMTKT